jgi:SAM-dependent methyltransferase
VTRAREHWDTIYRSRSPAEVSWYAPHLPSLDLIRETPRHAAIIDIGGGASTLVDDLLEDGYRDLTVLDISEAALEITRRRLGARASAVEWLVSDVTDARRLPRMYDLWHDRAVFHFLTLDAERHAYARLLRQSLKPGGRAILTTFAPEGPPKCSGLPVIRYDPESLKRELGEPLDLRSFRRVHHRTPAGKEQVFVVCEFMRILCG